MSTVIIGQKALAAHYQAFRSRVNAILGDLGVNPQLGYGQTLAAPLVNVGDKIASSQWVGLQSDINKARSHQSGSPFNSATLPTVNFGQKITAAIVNSFDAAIALIEASPMSHDAGSMGVVSLDTETRSGAWGGVGTQTLSINGVYTFANSAAAQHFFNSGGELRIVSAHPDTSTNQNQYWNTALAAIGTISMSALGTSVTGAGTASSIGYFELTSSPQTIYQYNGGTIGGLYYNSNTVVLTASLSGAAVTFNLALTDGYSNGSSDSVAGGTTAAFSVKKAVTYLTEPTPTFSTSSWTASGGVAPTYSLIPSVSNVNEGGSVTWTLNTTGITNGVSFPWTLGGSINSQDVVGGAMGGNLTIHGNTASVTVSFVNDLTTEGPETATFTVAGTSSSITVNDTSTTPVPTYSLSNSGAINSGNSVTWTMNTTNVANGTVIPWSLSGAIPGSDISSTSGNFTINGGTANVTLTFNNDTGVNGVQTETLSSAGQNSAVNVTYANPPAYYLTGNALSVNEGSSVTFTFQATNTASGTSFPWTITGSVNSADIVGGAMSGNAVVDGTGYATVTVTLVADHLTEGTETLTFNIQGLSLSVPVNDTSLTQTFALSAKNTGGTVISSVNEGQAVNFWLNTTNVPDGTVYTWNVTGTVNAADFTGGVTSGTMTISSNQASVQLVLKADQVTEGAEQLTFTVAGRSVTITVNDTSVGYTYPTSGQSMSAVSSGGTGAVSSNAAPSVITLYTYGGVGYSADVTSGPSIWVSTTDPSPGSSHYIRITNLVSSGNLSNTIDGNWHSMSSDVSFVASPEDESSGSGDNTFTIQIGNSSQVVVATFNAEVASSFPHEGA